MKESFAVLATLLIVAAYVPYIQNILRGRTKPHVYSWFLSALVTLIAFGVQLSEGAAWGAVPTFVAGIAGLVIFILALRRNNRSSITISDTFFLLLALIAFGLWLVADQALLSIIIISLVDILAFAPTIRKSWSRPDQETASSYTINTLRFTLATLAVQDYTLATTLYPLSQALFDGLFVLFLVVRRRSVYHEDSSWKF